MARSLRRACLLASALGALSAPALAQEPAEDGIETITSVGYRASFANSLEVKRDANQILDAITAEEIGQFPDQNIAEAIQRITGVQITRNNGEGESVNIRGLSANFTRVEIDGRTTAVTIDSQNPERASVLSVFASDLYNTIEVIKSPTAADVEGGVGGIVRLSTPSPLELGELSWGGDLGWSAADQRDSGEPSLNGFYSNVFMDDRIGVLLAGTYEKRDRAIDKFQSNQNWITYEAEGDPLDGGRFPGRLRQEQRRGEAPKYNVLGKLEFDATDQLRLSASGFYTLEEREEDRARIQSQFSRLRSIESGTLDAATGTIVELQSDNRVRTDLINFARRADVETLGLTGGFDWTNDIWTLTGEANFSSSEEDFTETRASHRENRDTAGYSIVNDPEYPEFFSAIAQTTPDQFGDLSTRDLDQQQRIISLEETSFELDAERVLDLGPIVSVAAGVRYASAEFDRQQGQVDSPLEGELTYGDGVPFFVVDGGSFADGFGGDDLLRYWPTVVPIELYAQAPSTTPFVFDDENFWTITEDVAALYGMANFETDLSGWFARGNAGVRLVQTTYEGVGRRNVQSPDLSDEIDAINGGEDEVYFDAGNVLDRDYTEALPSVNLVLAPAEDSKLQLRGAISKALSRSTLEQINPGEEFNTDDLDYVTGNPELDPFTAWQYDAGIEYYFDDETAITAAVFYKDVENFIVPESREVTLALPEAGIGELTYQLESFRNGGEASIQGFEIGVQAPFTSFAFVPEALTNFGLFANYTFTDSEFTDDNGNTFTFPGASENAFNLVGYYERGGFSGRLAYNYRDEFLIEPGQTDGGSANAEFGDEQGRLDLGLRYRFENGARISFDALNLTEEQNYKYYDTAQRLEDLEVEGRIYTIRVGFVH